MFASSRSEGTKEGWRYQKLHFFALLRARARISSSFYRTLSSTSSQEVTNESLDYTSVNAPPEATTEGKRPIRVVLTRANVLLLFFFLEMRREAKVTLAERGRPIL